jgi:hypothetical protein
MYVLEFSNAPLTLESLEFYDSEYQSAFARKNEFNRLVLESSVVWSQLGVRWL